MKNLILVTSPPACGKTFISKEIARALEHVVYLDKDTLIVLSKQIFEVAAEPYNRSSQFFEEYIRNYEYMAIVDLALEALEYEDNVLINAPFTREIRDPEYMQNLKELVRSKGAKLIVIWVETLPEICKKRMIERASDRDSWKIAHWEEYIKGVNFEIPKLLENPKHTDGLLIFKNSSDEEFEESMINILAALNK